MSAALKPKNHSVASLEAEMLRRVRARGGMSRTQLAHELALAPSTAGIYVDRLIRAGFLLEGDKPQRESAGRPPTLLLPNPDGGRYVGVDFEAHNILATAVDFSQQPLRQVHETIRGSDSVEEILRRLERAIETVVEGDDRPVLAIGVGVPGAVDPAGCVAQYYPFIRGWRNVPLRSRLAQRFGVSVFLENNIRSMALAEMWFGQGRGVRNFVCIGIRTGIAAGVVVNGQLLRGDANQAGEIGHWSCPLPIPPGKRAIWGGNNCAWKPGVRMEELASLSAIVALAQRARERHVKTSLAGVKGAMGIDDVLRAARLGDSFARSLIESVAWVHGWLVWQLCSLFDPQRIVFSGPLAELGELFLAPVQEAAAKWGGAKPSADITCSALGQYNGALGAAALALHQWKPVTIGSQHRRGTSTP